ncbi:TetR/AcrR family transcriptional regulator [Limibacillus halophilus]|nr:TetR/AcrR family transcriptional regulator [Limibacillus halophilus]
MSSKIGDTQTRILASTWELLENARGKEVRMADIAKHAKVSRQALYLHFPSRRDLLIATTHYIDKMKDVDARLAASRSAKNGRDRLNAFIEAWGNYIPEIHGLARELMAMSDRDEAAKLAWNERMTALRQGCHAAVMALRRDGCLSPEHTVETATDILCALVSVRNWEYFTIDRNWSQRTYVTKMKTVAKQLLVGQASPELP